MKCYKCDKIDLAVTARKWTCEECWEETYVHNTHNK